MRMTLASPLERLAETQHDSTDRNTQAKNETSQTAPQSAAIFSLFQPGGDAQKAGQAELCD